MFNVTEDDEYFTPTASSNLASLFGTSMTNHDTTLSYTAPKQPKIQDKSPKSQSSVICSKFVDAFKLVDNEHENQGKCGIAIIGSDALNMHDIILYKSKQDIIMRTKLKTSFTFHTQSNNFASFCDDQQQRWSIHFENLNEIDEFVKEISTCGGQIVRQPKTLQKKPSGDSDTSDTSTTKTKANILTRMAKMGQSILPKADVSDVSEPEETTVVKKTKKLRPKDKPTGDQTVNLPISQSEFVIVNGKPLPISALQQNFSLPNQPFWGHSDPFNIFIAENRTHNCEMRMNVSQLSSKLDKLLEEVGKGTNVQVRDDSLKRLEEENRALQGKLQMANEEIGQLRVENENYVGIISKHDDSEQRIKELQETISKRQSNLEELSKFYAEHKDDNKQVEELKTKLAVKRDTFSKKLKLAMNNLYQSMMETFADEDVTFRALEIKEVLSKNLKTTTFNVIEQFNNDFKDEEEDGLPSVPN